MAGDSFATVYGLGSGLTPVDQKKIVKKGCVRWGLNAKIITCWVIHDAIIGL
ncbi:hypothetical protein FD25_GL002569 [Levilactobacillus acidifarinae DSM 19394]|uniref:Uncharacterized protein n=1 Tax=Levilactobacillus acidifarinae DSM 19394 = JCM 15949 TaxID=1423715 RepID=A0A0R1LUM3_9LACO|nr:hypothetical protein FD25_GL002569 [Levilactobacillus acidifarinae DSM 19394]